MTTEVGVTAESSVTGCRRPLSKTRKSALCNPAMSRPSLEKTSVGSVTRRMGTRMVGVCGVWPNIVAVKSSRANRFINRLRLDASNASAKCFLSVLKLLGEADCELGAQVWCTGCPRLSQQWDAATRTGKPELKASDTPQAPSCNWTIRFLRRSRSPRSVLHAFN